MHCIFHEPILQHFSWHFAGPPFYCHYFQHAAHLFDLCLFGCEAPAAMNKEAAGTIPRNFAVQLNAVTLFKIQQHPLLCSGSHKLKNITHPLQFISSS